MRHLFIAALVLLILPLTTSASPIAHDDAADPVYTLGAPYSGLNGGFGLTAWQHSLPAFPATSGGPLHAYVGSSAANDPAGPPLPDIDTFGSSGPVAWGNNADPTGNTFAARRSLTTDVPVGGTFAISYDNGDVDGQETIAFGQGSNNICQFFFNPATNSTNYQFTDTLSATTFATPISQTWGGVRLLLTRDSASTYSFSATRLSDSASFTVGPFSYNTTLITGIRTINITNTDGGNGPGHSMYVNSIDANSVPEPACLFATVMPLGLMLGRRLRRKL